MKSLRYQSSSNKVTCAFYPPPLSPTIHIFGVQVQLRKWTKQKLMVATCRQGRGQVRGCVRVRARVGAARAAPARVSGGRAAS